MVIVLFILAGKQSVKFILSALSHLLVGSSSNVNLVLKAFAMQAGSVPTHAAPGKLRFIPLHTQNRGYLLQLSSVRDAYILWLKGAHFLGPLARKIGFSGSLSCLFSCLIIVCGKRCPCGQSGETKRERRRATGIAHTHTYSFFFF